MNLRVTANLKPYIAPRAKNQYKLNLRKFKSSDIHNSNITNKAVCTFKIGDFVKNEDGLHGKINNINDKYIIVGWNDNTTERVQLGNSNYLLIDDTDHLNDYTDDNTDNDVNTISEVQKPSLDEIKEEHAKKVTALKKQNKDIQTIRYNTAKDIISLAAEKGLIDEDDIDVEMMKLSSMDDDAFQEYKQKVIDYHQNGQVYSIKKQEIDEDYSGLTAEQIEAKKKLNELKNAGIISSTSYDYSNAEETRSLSDLSGNANYKKPQTLEDSFAALFEQFEQKEEQEHERMKKAAAITRNEEPHSGLRQPLIMGANEENQFAFNSPVQDHFAQLFQALDWTTAGSKVNIRG